jgi:hypothetical protein
MCMRGVVVELIVRGKIRSAKGSVCVLRGILVGGILRRR